MRTLDKRRSSEKLAAPGWLMARRLLLLLGMVSLAWYGFPPAFRAYRNAYIRQLAASLEQTSDDQVAIPIQRLADFGLPAIDALVAVAASDRVIPATQARDLLESWQKRWLVQSGKIQSQVKANKDSAFLSQRMSLLAEALAHHVDSMTQPGKQWAGRMTTQILIHTDHIPSTQITKMLADCQTVIAAIPASTSRLVLPKEYIPEKRGAQKESQSPAIPISAATISDGLPSFDWSLFATVPESTPNRLGSHTQNSTSRTKLLTDSNPTATLAQNNLSPDSHFRSDQPGNHNLPLDLPDSLASSSPTTRKAKPRNEKSQTRASKLPKLQSMDNPLRTGDQESIPKLPTQLKQAIPLPMSKAQPMPTLDLLSDEMQDPVIDVPTPTQMAALRRQFESLSIRELMLRLAQVHGFEANLIRAIAQDRGVSDLELQLAPKLGATQVSQRLELLQQLSDLSAGQGRRWLRWLLEDHDSEVRFQALSRMATTDDPQLEKIVRELALREPDPRILSLANKIIGIQQR